jgi:hypothetical protein
MDMDNQVSDERGKIPELMKIGQIPSDLSQDVDTEVLDPVVNNDNFCRFVLSNKGFLHSFSKITLGLTSTGDDDFSTFPINIGVHSLIQRCALRIGTTIVAEIDDFNHWMAYKSMFIDNDINYERETYLTSRITATELLYDNDGQSIINSSALTIKTRQEPVQDDVGQDGSTDPQVELRLVNQPVFSVSVADLFPFLRFNQLPLYMIDQQISIELHYQPASSFKRCVHATGVDAQGQSWLIDTTQTKFIADYIYYDGDLMEQYKNQNKVMNWTYADYRLNKRTLTQAQTLEKTIMDIGGAGRLCNRVITSLSPVLATPDTSLTNEYSAIAPATSNNNNGTLTTNLIYNDNRLYPIDRTNPAIHFHDLVQTEQNIPHVCRQMYNKEGDSFTDQYLYQEYQISSSVEGLNGKFHHIGYRLNRNERVNSRGIQLEIKYSNMLAGTFTHRTWLELVKTATLNDGRFSTEFS